MGYNKASLLFHPDKIGEKVTKEDTEIWLNV